MCQLSAFPDTYGLELDLPNLHKYAAEGRGVFDLRLKARKILALAALGASGIAFVTSPLAGAAMLALNYYDPFSITEYRLKSLSTDQIVEKIELAIADQDLDDAAKLVEIGQEHGHTFDPALIARTQEDAADVAWRNSIGFADGFLRGQVSSPSNIAGSLVADYLVLGDLRDIAVEGTKAASGSDYHELTLGLSLVGVATLIPGTGPVDVGASVVKIANKGKRLTKPMASTVERMAKDLLDVPALKKALSSSSEPMFRMPAFAGVTDLVSSVSYKDIDKVDFTELNKVASDLVPIDMGGVKRRFSGVLKPDALAEVSGLTSATAAVASRGGIKATFKALEHADNPADLARFGKLADKTGDRTSSVIRLLGKGAIHLGDLVYTVIAAVALAIAWMLGAVWSSITFVLNLRTLFR